jgi:hypothetical protein
LIKIYYLIIQEFKTAYVDQLDIKTFNGIITSFGDIKYDLIIDDGLHSIGANLNTLLFALQNIKSGGWIVIEDIYKINNWYIIHVANTLVARRKL